VKHVLRRIFSTDHKVIGLQYGFTSMFFLLVGFALVILIRWQHAYSGQPLPFFGGWLGETNAPGGVITPEFYNQLGAMHGTIMVFLGVVPLAFGAFGNYIVPLQIGAPDMAFPRLNALSYWLYLAGGIVMLVSFFVPGGAANNGWTSYVPLSDIAPGHGQTLWLVGMLLLIFSSLLGAMNFIATIIQLRAPGMTWFRLPFFVWAQFITAFLLLLAFPALRPCCRGWIALPAPASSCPADSSSPASPPTSPAAAMHCSGSICSGSWGTPRCTS
jgi:cytochrome c oxidase subunit 1